MKSTLDRIRAAVGEDGYLDTAGDMAPYLEEWRGLFPGKAAAVLCPADVDQVSKVLALCNEAGIGVVPQGGNTGLVGGAAPRDADQEIVLSLRRMNRIRDLDAANYTLTAEAGCVLANLQKAAEEEDRLFPLSLGAEGSCQIGGNLATNAGGTNVLRYGNARDLCLGLEVVLADGRIWDGLTGLRKDNTGYDLKQLFIGSEGTLGVITAAVLKLFSLPKEKLTAFVAMDEPEAAIEILARLRDITGDAVTACELIPRFGLELTVRHIENCRDPFGEPHPWYLLAELSSPRPDEALRQAFERILAGMLEEGKVADVAIAGSLSQAEDFWRIREEIPEAQTREGASIKHDVSVPVSKVPAFIGRATEAVEKEMADIRVCAFGHLGDGNIHFNLSQPENADPQAFLNKWDRFGRIVHDLVAEFGGSFSAEHGIGQLKPGELARYKSKVDIELMRGIKQTLDPNNILNPGKVLLADM